jgi:hypothetical protein
VEKLFSEVYPYEAIPDDTRARLAELIDQETGKATTSGRSR